MKLSTKLILSLSILILLSIAIGLFSINRMSSINKETNELATNWLPTIKVVGELNDLLSQFRRKELLHVLTTDETAMRENEAALSNLKEAINKKMKQYEPLISEPGERENYPKFQAAWEKFLAIHKQILLFSQKNENESAAKLALGESDIAFREASRLLTTLIDINAKGGDSSAASALASYESGKTITIIVLIVAIVIGTLLSWLLTHNILNQLGEDPGYLLSVASEIANGNLNISFKPFKGAGGVYAVLIKMVTNLKDKIAEADNKSQEAAKEAQAAREATILADEATKKAEQAKAEGMLQAAQ